MAPTKPGNNIVKIFATTQYKICKMRYTKSKTRKICKLENFVYQIQKAYITGFNVIRTFFRQKFFSIKSAVYKLASC